MGALLNAIDANKICQFFAAHVKHLKTEFPCISQYTYYVIQQFTALFLFMTRFFNHMINFDNYIVQPYFETIFSHCYILLPQCGLFSPYGFILQCINNSLNTKSCDHSLLELSYIIRIQLILWFLFLSYQSDCLFMVWNYVVYAIWIFLFPDEYKFVHYKYYVSIVIGAFALSSHNKMRFEQHSQLILCQPESRIT